MEKVKNFFREFDLFAALPTLRAKSNPETVNTCGGILSLLVTLFFIYIFIYQFVQVANWEKIQAVQTQINDISPEKNISKFMVGIGIEGFPLQISQPFIRFEFIELTMNGTRFVSSRTLKKEKCTLSHWEPQLGSSAEDSFNSFSVQNKYCITLDENFTIYQISNQQYKILSVTVSNCRRLTHANQSIYQNCASQQEILQGNNNWIKLFKYFTVTTVFSNTGFQPTAKESTKKYMDIIRSTFTLLRGTQTFVYLSQYKITTDSSILPFNDYQIEEGHYLDDSKSQNFQSNIYFENINIFFAVSPNSIEVERKLGKVDDILSYAGGLFGIIISVLSFFMMSFNQYRYQIMVGEEAFNYSQDGSKVRQHDFHFLLYMKYSLYDWIKTLTCFQPKWKHCKEIDQTRQEANNQLNVTLLFKKIQHIQKIIQYILPEKQDIGIYLTEPPSIDQVIRKRRIAQYYEKVIKGKSATTVEDIDNVTHILSFAIGLQNSRSQLVINSQSTKRRLNEHPLKSREDILQKIFQNFEKDIEIEDTNLDQEDEKIELQIAESFFRMNQIARKKIQEKIPLKILFRLKKRYETNISKSNLSINLQI